MTTEDGALASRETASPARAGWAEAARFAESGDDEPVMGEFGNPEDAELEWRGPSGAPESRGLQ